jgi:hypothetical protein
LEFPVKSAGIWGEAIREREPILNNNFLRSGLLKVYKILRYQISRYINITSPRWRSSSKRCAAVANKLEYYNSSDVKQLTLLLNGMWKLIKENFLMRNYSRPAGYGKVLESVINDSPGSSLYL